MATADVATRRQGALALPSLLWLLVVTASGLATAVALGWTVVGWPGLAAEPAALWQPVAYAACLVVAESFDVRLPFRDHRYTVSVADAVIVLGLFWLPPAPFVLATGAGIAISQVLTEGETIKRVFNTAHYTLAAGAAAAVMSLVEGDWPATLLPRLHLDPVGPPTLTSRLVLAVLAGMVVFFLVSHALLMFAISLAAGQGLAETWRRVTPVAAALWAANSANGLVAAVLIELEPRLLPALAVPVGLSVLANRAWARGMAERERSEALYAAGRALSGRPGDLAWPAFVEHAATALHADGVAILIGRARDAAVDVIATDHAPERLLVPSSAALWEGAARAWAERNGWARAEVVAIRTGAVGGHLVAFGRRGRRHQASDFGPADRQAMQTLAAQAAAALQADELWHETERERAQLRDIVAHSSDGIYTVAADRTVRSWNPAMAAISGLSAAEAVGRSCSDLLAARGDGGADLCVEDCPILLAAATGHEVTRDAAVRTKDGGERLISYAHTPITGAGGIMETDVVVVRDVTSRRRTDDAKADFVANISHELRSPLTPIKGFLLTLLREDRWFAEERRREYYRLMLGQSERLEALIEDLLAVTRVEGGARVPAAEEIDAAGLVERAVARCRAEAPGRAIEARLPGGPGTARGHGQRAEEVLGHLLGNAVRYSPAGAPITVTLEAGGDEVLIHVRDAGPGIGADEQTRIFERFHRGGYYLTREPGGAGLGLYLSKRLVEAMGGRIWVASRLGEGSTFSFALPAWPRR